MNHRKEFFRVDLKTIRQEIQDLGLDPKWTMTAAAAEYRETQVIETKIKADPAMREAWVKRQLEMEILENDLPEADTRLRSALPLHEPAETGK